MATATPAQECIVQDGCINVPYTWTVGANGSYFFTELRDKKRIWGTRCSVCEIVYVPPRKGCPRCFCEPLEWIEVGPQGTLQTFTVVRYADPAIHPVKAPLAYGVIKLDRAETGLVHIIGDAQLDEIISGMRVEAVFNDERRGSILDIKHFRPVRS